MKAPIALLLAAACAACAPAGGNNVQQANAASEAAAADAVAVVTVAAPGGACAFTWNGNPTTRAAIVAQGEALARATIRERGGIGAMTERTFPYARVEAAAALPFDCVALALGDLQRAGFPSVTLRLAGGGGAADHRAYVINSHDGPYTPRAITMMGTGARLAWNEEEIDLATLRRRARALRGSAVTPDDFVLVPAGDTDFGAVHAAVGTVRAAGLDLYLAGCAREAGSDPRSRAVWGSTRPPPRC
ncbi:MAG TPA: hypothetical protein VGO55_13870 [Allosphingosinicella sp.]|jgi:hypothetical protein|nr:hypothetical protein [Allosphingosinicella sp.]